MNRAINRLGIAALTFFLLLLGWVNYVQVYRTTALANEPGNRRIFDQQFQSQRGEIIADGDAGSPAVIAQSTLVKGTGFYQRHYPGSAAYAPVTGYDSIYAGTSAFGATGIERAENSYLAGTSSSLTVHKLISLFNGKSNTGATVYLTISPKAQQAAYQALAAMGKPAGLVAMDPKTGAILALASYPTFDPNVYTTLDSAQLAKVDAGLRNDPAQPLLNRALNETFPPGSTFKIVTSSAAFGTGKVADQNATIPAQQFYHLPGSTSVLTNDNNSPCGDGNPQIILAFTLSCNTAFGQLGVTVGPSGLHSYADAYGFNNPNLTIPLPVSASNYPRLADPAYTALSAIGQYSDTVTPLQEAMLAATVANGGTLMHPYLVSRIQAPDLQMVYNAQPQAIGSPVSPQIAGYLTAMMRNVTQDPNGTAYQTAGPPATSIVIAAKTGTAQNGVNNANTDDAVFTCFAPADNPRIVVGVIVKGGGFGADGAAPIALKVIQAYLGQH